MPSRFRIDWVLVNELAIGPAPRAARHLDQLQEQHIKAVLSLCGINEAPAAEGLAQRFEHRSVVLPDHRTERLPELAELLSALDALRELRGSGPVFVHCLAGIERSPLVCLAWLVSGHGQSPLAALDYLMQVHPGTNPLPGQLQLLHQLQRIHP